MQAFVKIVKIMGQSGSLHPFCEVHMTLRPCPFCIDPVPRFSDVAANKRTSLGPGEVPAAQVQTHLQADTSWVPLQMRTAYQDHRSSELLQMATMVQHGSLY